MSDEFYIGWEAKAAPGISKTLRRVVLGLLLLAVGGACVLAASQRLIGGSVFEWGNEKSFAGVLRLTPYPHLLTPRPGHTQGQSPYSTYYLVAPWKFGLNRAALATLDGKMVSLQGALIYRGNQTMIEVVPDSIRATNSALSNPLPAVIPLGKLTLVGEIVDSKCFLGVMNPGQLTPHRACAIRCISGGIPPVLLVRQHEGPALYLLLVSADGRPVNQQVLPLVAEPVEITGEVERHGELLILRADPTTYQRVK